MKKLIVFAVTTLIFPALGLKAQIITTIAGNGIANYSGDGGLATAAELNGPSDVAVDDSGNIYIADYINNVIRKVYAKDGIIVTVAGNTVGGYGGDGGSATDAELYAPQALALDKYGNIYISDCENFRIRKVDKISGIISTFAGNGMFGFSGDGGQATIAEFDDNVDIALDTSGNLYITDEFNYRLRFVNISTGIITTIVGNGSLGSSGNGGQATSAELNRPCGVAVDDSLNIYITEYDGNFVRKVEHSTGIIYTIAGTGVGGYNGDARLATSAELYNPYGIKIDKNWNVLIADARNARIREINPSTGIITTIIGNGVGGYSGDRGLATLAEISAGNLTLDSSGTIFLADEATNHIRKVTSVTGIERIINKTDIQIFPNPNSGIFHINIENGESERALTIYTILGSIIYQAILTKGENLIQLGNVSNGIYFYKISSCKINQSFSGKLIINK